MEGNNFVVIFVILYFVFAPLLIILLTLLKKKIKMMLNGNRRERNIIQPKPSLMRIIGKHLRYTLREARVNKGPRPRFILILTYLLGVFLIILTSRLELYNISIGLLFYPYLLVAYSIIVSRETLKKRDKKIEKLLSVKKERMGLIGTPQTLNQNEEFQVLKWADNNYDPVSVRIFLPTAFDELQEPFFLEQFSLVFGVEGSRWVADMTDPKHPGFNYNEGIATISMMKPLPRMAPWHEKYLLNPAIAWSFFPLALGAEKGIQITDPETGETQHVLGFDLAGEAAKVAEKAGAIVGPELVAAPQVLCAGGTGGGKSLALDTLIQVVN